MLIYNLQLFGGRGGGSGKTKSQSGGRNISSMSIEQLESKVKQLEDKMAKLYREAVDGDYTEWRKVLFEKRPYEERLRELLNARSAERRKAMKSTQSKTFVNSYGEATKREITTSTYKRAQARADKDILRNMGY